MIRTSIACLGLALFLGFGASISANAQAAAGNIKPGDAEYVAIQDLGAKGLIDGYPATADFLGGRTLTRYEMAALLVRVNTKIDAAEAAGTTAASIQPQIDEAKLLTDEYRVELTIIGANVGQASPGDIASVKQGLSSVIDGMSDQAKQISDLKAQIKTQGNSTYGSSKDGRYSISGLVQSRYVNAVSGNSARFPEGNASKGQYNGNYAQGDTASSFEVRRARVIMIGNPTDNMTYKLQMDIAGAINAPTANTQINVLEAYGMYTFGNGAYTKDGKFTFDKTNGAKTNGDTSSKDVSVVSPYPSISVGEFANPFGYIQPVSPTGFITPERPLAFSEANNVGLFDSQDYDKGVRVIYNPNNWRFIYAAVNGAGRQSESIDNHFDSILHAGYTSTDKVFTVGTSYYDGHIYRPLPTGVTNGMDYPLPKKQLYGFDAEIKLKDGIFADSEYIRGTYEKQAFFDEDLFTSAAPAGGDALQTHSYVPGNQVQGYYIWGGYTFNSATARPLTLAFDYDGFQRAMSGTNTTSSNPGNSSYDDLNYGGGILYNLDKATRVRLWYEEPIEVAHLPGTVEPPKIGLETAELQVKF